MPRGGPPTNTYVLPAIYLAIPGTTILATQHNSPLEDIEAVLNQAWPTNIGGTGGTSAITSYDALNTRGTAVPSSATLDLDNVTGPNLHVTGVVTVTAVGLSSGKVRQVIADGAFQITASASLIVDGSASVNYTTVAGDLLTFIGDPLGVVRVFTEGSVNSIVGDLTLTSTDAGAAAAPVLTLNRASATPAVNDILGKLLFNGRDSAANVQEYGSIEAVIADPVSGSEDAGIDHYAVVAGARTRVISVGPNLQIVSKALISPASSSSLEFDGVAFYATSVASSRQVIGTEQITTQVNDFTGTNVNTAQPVFASDRDALTVASNTSYEFEALYRIDTTGTTSHSIGVLFGGTATISALGAVASATNGTAAGTPSAPSVTHLASATLVTLTAAVATATQNLITIRGIMRVTTGGTVIPQFQYSAAPGVAPTIRANSFFRAWPIGSDTVGFVGNFS